MKKRKIEISKYLLGFSEYLLDKYVRKPTKIKSFNEYQKMNQIK